MRLRPARPRVAQKGAALIPLIFSKKAYFKKGEIGITGLFHCPIVTRPGAGELEKERSENIKHKIPYNFIIENSHNKKITHHLFVKEFCKT